MIDTARESSRENTFKEKTFFLVWSHFKSRPLWPCLCYDVVVFDPIHGSLT